MSELVSVVIATYQRDYSLERAIKSVIDQSYENLEVLVIDDNVMDDYHEIVDRIVHSFSDSRIKLYKNGRNLGGALSRNVGIDESKGDYIAFLDDDDVYLPTKIGKQYKLMKSDENIGLVYSYCDGVNKEGKVIKKYRYNERGYCLFSAMKECFAATSQWLCKREALLKVGGFADMPCKQDSALLVKILAYGYKVDRVPEVLSLYFQEGENRISASGHEKRIAGEEKLLEECRKYYNQLSKREIELNEYYSACRLIEHYWATKDIGKYKACRKKILKHPFNINTCRAIKHIINLNVKR